MKVSSRGLILAERSGRFELNELIRIMNLNISNEIFDNGIALISGEKSAVVSKGVVFVLLGALSNGSKESQVFLKTAL